MIITKREDLARMIKSACALQGVSVEGLGRRLGVVGPSIHRTVNRSDLGFSPLHAIAEALGCDLYIALLPKDRGQAERAAGLTPED